MLVGTIGAALYPNYMEHIDDFVQLVTAEREISEDDDDNQVDIFELEMKIVTSADQVSDLQSFPYMITASLILVFHNSTPCVYSVKNLLKGYLDYNYSFALKLLILAYTCMC